jgi:hypothetical protein
MGTLPIGGVRFKGIPSRYYNKLAYEKFYKSLKATTEKASVPKWIDPKQPTSPTNKGWKIIFDFWRVLLNLN